MAASKNSTRVTLTISSHWQVLFIVAAFLSWIWPIAELTHVYTGPNSYIGSGTWLVTVTFWVLPFLYFGIAYALLSRYPIVLKRMFMACMAAVTGMVLYTVGAGIERDLWSGMAHPISNTSTGLWAAYGNDWTVMAIGLVIFTAGLYIATHKGRRL